MLEGQRIIEVATQVIGGQGSDANLERIIVTPATDSEGQDALRLTLVLKPDAKLTGDEALDILVGIQRGLEKAGEERFPIIEYATEQELQLDGDEEEADVIEDDA